MDVLTELSTLLGIRGIRILELIYQKQTYMLNDLIKDLRIRYKIKETKPTIISDIKKLNELGLVKMIKGKPLFINEVIGFEKNIISLVFVAKERYRLK